MSSGWEQSYKAGYVDGNGKYAGGSEIMHIEPHKGRLFAANGYWEDSRWKGVDYADRQSAQVLRLDSSDGRWEVDLEMGDSNGEGRRYMKGNILKSVTFARDEFGVELPEPVNLLVMSAGAYYGEESESGVVSAWVRDDEKETWSHEFVKSGPAVDGVRWIPRDIEIYRDKVTGVERIFLLIGNPGIISGVYDASQPSKIRWDENVEFPSRGAFGARPLGMVTANGSLLFSAEGAIYLRIDGQKPA